MTSHIDFRTYHKAASQAIGQELQTFSEQWNRYIKTSFPDLVTLNQLFTDSLFGGKMLRGTLVMLGYELTGSKSTKEILKPAIAYEIVHTSLLIHDDIIDQSPLRRGKPTIHARNKNAHHGISQAICLGDMGIMLAHKLIAESNFPDEQKNHAIGFFLQNIIDTILGETIDVESSYALKQTENQVLTIHKMKTAHYTIVGPLSLGAIFGGASETLLENIKLFGEYLGTAYQIQDDMLGIFGDEAAIGKSTTSDIEENKSTLLLTYGLEQATQEQKKYLETHYGKKGITKEQQERIKQIFIETGSLTYSQNKAAELTEKAKKLIPNLSNDKNKQGLLLQFTEALVEREK